MGLGGKGGSGGSGGGEAGQAGKSGFSLIIVLFILHVFQLAFSSDDHRKEIWKAIETWDTEQENHMDWEKFQTEYRDYIDLAKMLQLV
ncbi:EcsC family protein, partial [Bacillus sp. D-CC]